MLENAALYFLYCLSSAYEVKNKLSLSETPCKKRNEYVFRFVTSQALVAEIF